MLSLPVFRRLEKGPEDMSARTGCGKWFAMVAIISMAALAIAGCGAGDSTSGSPEGGAGESGSDNPAMADVSPAPGYEGAEQAARDWFTALTTYDETAFCALTSDAAVEDLRQQFSTSAGQELEGVNECADLVALLREIDPSGGQDAGGEPGITPLGAEPGPEATSAELSVHNPATGEEMGVELEVLDGRWTVTGLFEDGEAAGGAAGSRSGGGGPDAMAAGDPCEFLNQRQVARRLPGPASPEPDLGWSGGQCRWQVESGEEARIIVGLAPWPEFGELTEDLTVDPEPIDGLGDEAVLLEGTVAPGTFSSDGRTLYVRQGSRGIGIVWDRSPDPPPTADEMRQLATEVLE